MDYVIKKNADAFFRGERLEVTFEAIGELANWFFGNQNLQEILIPISATKPLSSPKGLPIGKFSLSLSRVLFEFKDTIFDTIKKLGDNRRVEVTLVYTS